MRCEWLTESMREEEILAGLQAPVGAWWRGRFSEMSLAQRMAIPAIAAGKHVLVCAPTGTGKTLCAFISILSDLLKRAAEGRLPERIDTVYVSPLKALSTDITRNLTVPLEQICGEKVPVRVGQRTGDTTPRQRSLMVKKPPHILVTTPESLALCLASAGMRRQLSGVRRIVLDELHSLAVSKRGADLMLSVERLGDFVERGGGGTPQRIGLSATIAPLERMAGYLVGGGGGEEPCCSIADAGFARPIELDVASVFGRDAKSPFITTAAINRGVYDYLEKTIREHRTTLVFTNLRSATERVTYALRKRFAAALDKGETSTEAMIHPQQIQAHHSSLDRDVRLEIERRMKAGELRCVVCSTSLELGIDIGTIDRVVLLNNPRGVARGLQRVGRSGHSLGSLARGTFVPTTPADLIEALVTRRAMRDRAIGEVRCVENCADVLAQHLIGMAVQAWPDGIDPERAFAIARRTTCLANLPREKFGEILRFLAGEGDDTPARGYGRLCWDLGTPENPQAQLRLASKGVAGMYAQNVGTIVQEGQVKVRVVDGAVLGTIEEAFAQVLKVGDRFVLGGSCLRVEGSHGMTVDVVECAGQMPTVPRWFSGMMAMEPGLAGRMREFRTRVRAIAPAGEAAIARMLSQQYGACHDTARTAASYLAAQHHYADIPVDGELLVERVPDEAGGPLGGPACVLVFHTMIGRAANEALARVVAYRMQARFGNRPWVGAGGSGSNTKHGAGGATVVIDDYAFGVWIEATTAARRADRTLVRSLLSSRDFDADLIAAVQSSDLFRTQFRFTAIRSQAILQNKFGRRRFIGQMQSYATRLYEQLRETDPQHPLIAETRRTVLEDILCAPAARDFLDALATRNVRLLDLATPSPFAFGLFATSRRDTLHLADTADILLAMYQRVRERLAASAAPVQAALFS